MWALPAQPPNSILQTFGQPMHRASARRVSQETALLRGYTPEQTSGVSRMRLRALGAIIQEANQLILILRPVAGDAAGPPHA